MHQIEEHYMHILLIASRGICPEGTFTVTCIMILFVVLKEC